jgi:hypothetical protein
LIEAFRVADTERMRSLLADDLRAMWVPPKGLDPASHMPVTCIRRWPWPEDLQLYRSEGVPGCGARRLGTSGRQEVGGGNVQYVR